MSLNIDPLAMLKAQTDKANEIGRKIQASKADKSETVKAILDTSDDTQIVKFREGRQKIETEIATLQAKIVNGEAKIKEYAESLVPPVEEGFDVEAATKEFLAARAEATSTEKALLNFVSAESLAEAKKELGIVPIVSLRGSGTARANSAPGTTKRPRISAATIDGENVWKTDPEGDNAGKVDFTHLASVLKSDAETVKAAAFSAAGTDELNSLDAGTVVSFTLGEKKVTVTVSGEKPGRKAAAETSSDENVSDEAPAETEVTSAE